MFETGQTKNITTSQLLILKLQKSSLVKRKKHEHSFMHYSV